MQGLGWALILALPILVLAGVEGCARLFDITPPVGRTREVPAWLDRNLLAKEARWMELLAGAPRDLRNYYSTYAWDRHLFYRLRPNVAVPLTDVMAPPGVRERTRWTLRTNAYGFPGREVAPGPHPGTYRIVCMGDSSTFGWGVESDEAYPALLEAELRRRHPDLRLEVVNLGVCGYSSFQGRILMEREALRWEPDLVTISYGSNDWSHVPEPFDEAYARNAGWVGAVRSLLHKSRAYGIYAAYVTRLFAGEPDPAGGGRGEAEMPLNVGPEKSEANLEALVAAARKAGAEAILVTNCVPGRMSEPVRSAAEAAEVPLLDTEALLRSAIPALAGGRLMERERGGTLARYGEALLAEHPDLEVYLADRCHPNPVGHRILARALADLVERTLLLADRPQPSGEGDRERLQPL